MTKPLVPPEALAAQARSSDPSASVWVSANAGAGKTFVLSRRVVRLLLSGVPPRSILCLTYTNAAAAEMALRVYKLLAELATMPEERLRAEVAGLAPAADPAEAAARARTLFAETLETPGGLKVQTLHAFAAALLRRFPLEANVAGSFQILDDATRAEMTERAIAGVLARAAADPSGPIAAAVAALVPHVSDFALPQAIAAVLAARRQLIGWIGRGADPDTGGGLDVDPGAVAEDLAAALRLGDGEADRTPLVDEGYCRALLDHLEATGASADTAARIAAALGCEDAAERDTLWAAIFMKDDGAPRAASRIAVKAVRAAFPDLEERIAAEQARLERLAERRRAEAAIAATSALLVLAWPALAELEAEKRRRGLIDYDDQIEKARALVETATAAAWVRFKLDEGIDHLMVDEAQDTSPPQWELVGALVDEFFAGVGARAITRTLFVVGDEKQSIYSFQGAAPRLFAEKRAHYDGRATAAGLAFHAVELSHSFRSAPQVLAAVDRVFSREDLARAVGAMPGAVAHRPVKALRGGVDVWPLHADTPTGRPEDWDAPFDATPDASGHVKLVKAIADHIELWTGTEGPDGGPPVRPGDVLVLSRKREPLATLMNRELKLRGIPAAGADRLDVTAHIAVRDMVALARACLTRDDLSLACVLRSPLFGFSDEALFAVAHGRDGSLLAALERGDEAARAAHATLTRWRRMARRMRPFDFFSAILLGEGRRADFSARMGSEAEDALDALLDIALSFESRGVPAMETFLHRLERTQEELRRASDGTENAVRVMTVHGAKGLEAKIVFLADVGSRMGGGNRGASVVALPCGMPDPSGEVLLYCPSADHRPGVVRDVLAERAAVEAEEHYRLLYVGMTRAERHLVVCGSYGSQAPQKGMWHGLVREALAPDCTEFDLPRHDEKALAWRLPEPGPHPSEAAQDAPPVPGPPPAWLSAPAVLPNTTPPAVIPSEGEHEAATGTLAAARRPLPAAQYGAIVHALLEREDCAAAMAGHVRRIHPDLSGADVDAIVAEAGAVLALPELAAPVVRREVDLFGDVLLNGEVRRALARIDRLQLHPGRALVVDFKTDQRVPSEPFGAPEAYRRQLAIYRAVVRGALPAVLVETAIVWTAAARFMPMDSALPRIAPA